MVSVGSQPGEVVLKSERMTSSDNLSAELLLMQLLIEGRMIKMGKGKFFASAAIGAAVGGAIALFDRQTRVEMKEWAIYLFEMAKDPENLSASSKEIVNRAKETAQQISDDVSYIRGKVDNLKDLTPEVKDLVDETKSTFLPEGADAADTAEEKPVTH